MVKSFVKKAASGKVRLLTASSQPPTEQKRLERVKWFGTIFLVLFGSVIWAQTPRQDSTGVKVVRPVLLTVAAADRPIIQNISTNKQNVWLNDTTLKVLAPDAFKSLLQSASYLGASYDRWEQRDSLAYARLWLGPAYRWVHFRPANAQVTRWLETVRVERQFRAGQPVQPELFVRMQYRILENAENNGYPFAAIWLDSLEVDSAGGASGVLNIRPGPYFSYAALKMNGDVKLPKALLGRYLGIREGRPFSRSELLGIREQLKSLPYLEQYANPSVRFAGDKATVNVWVKKKRAGRFDFIVGLLPQPEVGTRGPGLLLTGSLNSVFLNALGQGERLSLEVERLRPETQKLDIQTSVPYIAGSPIGVEGRLNIFRRDSTWIDAQGNFGVLYLLSRANKVSFFVENRSSFLQKIDSARIVSTRQLPAQLDFRQNGLGAEIEFTKLDYRYNPRKGVYVQTKLYAGQHRTERNAQIEQLRDPNDETFQFASLYDSLSKRTYRIRPEGKVEVYIPFAQRFTVLVRARGGGIFTREPIAQNEQYRLGGNKLLRGFDEESLFATRWLVATSEFRLILTQNTYMAAFADVGYLENITRTVRAFQRPLGFGVGMNFETGAGVFGISAAVGRGNPGEGLDVRAAKVHIGYISIF